MTVATARIQSTARRKTRSEPFHLGDVADFVAYRSSGQVARFQSWDAPYPRAEVGMRQEGHLRESTWAKGEWTDDLLYGLLHYEWNPGRR